MSTTPEVAAALKEHFGVTTHAQVLDHLDVDVRWVLVDYVGSARTTLADGSIEDEFGIRFKTVANEYGSYTDYISHPLAEMETTSDLQAYNLPALDSWDYRSIRSAIAEADRVCPRWLMTGYASIFERAWGLMGFEKLLGDLALNPSLIEALFDQLLEFYIEQTSCILSAADGRIDMISIGDDVGTQTGPLISVDMFRHFLKGRWKTYIDTMKARFGSHLKIQYHSCGAVSDFIPDFIEMGADVLNPIQPSAAGMDAGGLKARFGNNLCFSGGLDIQQLLPRGTPQQVKTQATHLARLLGRSGGYIAAPSHAVQPDTSVVNILAMNEGFREA